ncbi:hypothetical protein N9T54_00400 [Alphaproteobacteria bacterium]|nr:hypothetical protein [Alphaproteobacteria bacterium]
MFLFKFLVLLDFLNPNAINKKLKIAKISAAGKDKINVIKGCQMNPEQFNTSRAEHGSTYLLIIASVSCRVLGEK